MCKLLIVLFVVLLGFNSYSQVSVKENVSLYRSLGDCAVEIFGIEKNDAKMLAQQMVISSNESGKIIQTINLEDKKLLLDYPTTYISYRDLNFDSYFDLVIAYNEKKFFTEERFYSCWLFDPETGKLIPSSLYDNLSITNVKINPNRLTTRQILTDYSFVDREFEYVHNTLNLVKETEMHYLKNYSELFIARERIANEMRIISKRLINEETGSSEMNYYLSVDNSIIRIFIDARCPSGIRQGEHRIGSIQVFSDDTLIQQITGDFAEFAQDAFSYKYILQDVNFDGYKDIRIMSNDYGHYNLWLYHPIIKKFMPVPEFSKLKNPRIEVKTKKIISEDFQLYAHCQSSCTTSYYEFYDFRLVLVNQTFSETNSNPNDLEYNNRDVEEKLEVLKPDDNK